VTGLADPVRLGTTDLQSRLVFGPHETNLGRHRTYSDRHVAYYRARAAGGAGLVVTEEASVDDSDWPYERAPLAERSAAGWAAIAGACNEEGAIVVAALGHAGGQGSSAYHQRPLWGPSSVPDVATREVPMVIEAEQIAALEAAFVTAAGVALGAGCDGVEINSGQWSLLRQFCSGLTNQRPDDFGADRWLLLRRVLAAVRAVTTGRLLGLRMSCDELAPWAGITPDAAADALAGLAAAVPLDYVTVVRGSAYGTSATRPDGHAPPGFNRDATALVRQALPRSVAVVAQGSIVDRGLAEEMLAAGDADLVEMTRALIAEPDLLHKEPARVRPCVLCNQSCQVRDVRNPPLSCITNPHAGHELAEPDPELAGSGSDGAGSGSDGAGAHLIVVGGGPAGLECARVAALAGMKVTVLEREEGFGGLLVRAAARMPGLERLAMFGTWLESECRLGGVELVSGHEATLEELDAHDGPVVCCTGSRTGRRGYPVGTSALVLTAAEILAAEWLPGDAPPSPVVVWDPIGGPIGVGTAELLARLGSVVSLVTPDFVAGEQLARSGDLAPANVRLQQAGVEIVKRSIVRAVEPESVLVEERYSGERLQLPAAAVVDAGHRLPEDSLYRAVIGDSATGERVVSEQGLRPGAGPAGRVLLAGDAVAPRGVLEAVLEGRRAAMALLPSPGGEVAHAHTRVVA
jgi:2,4-dienoyl-CoA reductase (NADPH2)